MTPPVVCLPQEGDLVATACSHPSVKAVVAHICLSTLEPGDADGALVHVKVIMMVVWLPLEEQKQQDRCRPQHVPRR